MGIIIPIITFWAILIVVFAIVNIKVSLYLYMSYLILVPNLQFNVLGLNLSYNLVNTVIIGAYLSNISFYNRNKLNEKRPIDLKVIAPFFFLFLSLLLLSFFADSIPFSLQFDYWRVSFMKTCIIPLVFWNIAKYDSQFIENTKKVLLGSIIIAGIYGLFLIELNGTNPYTSFLANYFGYLDSAGIYSGLTSRLSISSAAKIQSTMRHPMTYAFVLCFFILILIRECSLNKNRKIYIPVMILLLINLLISGVRTGIAALTIGFSYYVLINRRFKLMIYGMVIVIILYNAIKMNNDISSIFGSMIDVSGEKYNMHGSSIPMRLKQLEGTFDEINKNGYWEGKGYGWTSYYTEKYGNHPVIAGFESLIYYILLNSGVIGAICWSIFFYLLFRLNRIFIKTKQDIYFLDTFTIVYISYATITGEYGYISFFAMLYTFLMSSLCLKSNI